MSTPQSELATGSAKEWRCKPKTKSFRRCFKMLQPARLTNLNLKERQQKFTCTSWLWKTASGLCGKTKVQLGLRHRTLKSRSLGKKENIGIETELKRPTLQPSTLLTRPTWVWLILTSLMVKLGLSPCQLLSTQESFVSLKRINTRSQEFSTNFRYLLSSNSLLLKKQFDLSWLFTFYLLTDKWN